jgi:uncharacterized membrane protein YwaF
MNPAKPQWMGENGIGHTLIIVATPFLVVGLRRQPRRGPVRRVTTVAYIYVAFLGLVNALIGANYPVRRTAAYRWTLLRLMGA